MNIDDILVKVESLNVQDHVHWIQGLEFIMDEIRDFESHRYVMTFVYVKAGVERMKRHLVVGEAGVIDKTTESRDKIKSDLLKGLEAIKKIKSE